MSELLKKLLLYEFYWASLVAQMVESTCNAGDLGLIPEWEYSLEEDMATHSSVLAWRILMDRRVWWATVSGVAKNQTRPSN